MAAKVLSIPLSLGLVQRVDPKLAPLGVLATAKNLRVRKDGRLGSRTGYQPLTMLASNGSIMAAFDLHEYGDRLCALGNTSSDTYPTDLYEYTGVPSSRPWRASDAGSATTRMVLCPFTEPRQVGGCPQPAGGVSEVDCASGGGYVATAYKVAGATGCTIQIVRESNDQIIHVRTRDVSPVLTSVRIVYADGKFFFAGETSSDTLRLLSFTPGTDNSVQNLVEIDVGPGILNFEIAAITNPSTDKVIVAYDIGGTVSVKRYGTTGTQGGSTFTIGSLTSPFVDIEADAADNTINVLISHNTDDVVLRTYDFSNNLLDGPTALTDGTRAQLCRTPFEVVVAVNDETGGVNVTWYDIDTHAASNSTIIGQARMASRLVYVGSTGQSSSVSFGGWVETNVQDGTGGSMTGGVSPAADSIATNALFQVSVVDAHMMVRDLGKSSRDVAKRMGLWLDESTNRLAWASLNALTDDGSAIYTVSSVAVRSAKRRQSAQLGGYLHLAAGTPQIYEGRMLAEMGFNEIPGIKSITPGTAGSLFDSSTYSYVYHWEFTLPDGRFYRSAVSEPSTVTMGVGDDDNTLVLTRPHSTRLAVGADVHACDVVGVLSRTIWDDTNGAQGDQFHECKRFALPGGLINYGDSISVQDTASDASIATNPVVYTQEGPVPNDSPEACTFIAASSGRIQVAGLLRKDEMQESLPREIDQPLNFSQLSPFYTQVAGEIKGILSLDGTRILFTRSDAFAVSGEGPDAAGGNALPEPIAIPCPGGLRDWRSLLVGPDGVWFQLDDRKLYRMPRGGGAPTWEGVDVQDELTSFPVITGAARNRFDDTVSFSCSNAEADTDARILVKSLRTGLWTSDTPPLQTSKGIAALCSYGESVAYVSGGVVYVQSTSSYADGSSTPIVTQWKTHPIYPFGLGNSGKIHEVLLTGEYRSAGTIALRVSYDDGLNFTTLTSFAVSALTAGQTIQRKWTLTQNDLTSVVWELTFTPSAAGEGFIALDLAMLIEPTDGLKDLKPAEQS